MSFSPVQCYELLSIVLQALCLPDLIPYDYTVEVRNRFKGLDLVDIVADELWTEVCSVVQKVVTKIILMKEGKVVYLRRIYK